MLMFDRSPFKLFSLRFSIKLVQAPSCERPKTIQRTVFLSFEINNCIPVSAWVRHGSEGCGMAQIVARRMAVRQA